MASLPPGAAEAPRPLWKNPFAIAFVVGIVTLTAMPLLQRRLLRAPPPLRPLPAWALARADGTPFGSQQLAGHVWIASFASEACGERCLARQRAFGTMLDHTEDLGDRIHLVSFLLPGGSEATAAAGPDAADAGPGAPAAVPGEPAAVPEAPAAVPGEPGQAPGEPGQAPGRGLAHLAQVSATGRWHFVTGPTAGLEALVYGQFREAFVAFSPADAGVVPLHFADLPAFALVDQEGALRGFWGDDDPGRGNCINAARLLARLGPRP